MTFHQDIGFQPPPPPQPGSILPTIQSMREIQGQNALGAAYQQAVDPTTGRIDQAKLANALTASNAPWVVGPGGIQAGQSMQAQGQGTQEQLAAAHQQMNTLNGLITPLLQRKKGQPITTQDVQPYLDDALKTSVARQTG